jgi:hypothetical protein
MGWFTDTLNALDKPSNALQGLTVGGLEGMQRGWNQEENYDFEQIWDEDLQKKGWSEREGFGETASYIGSTALNLVFDPLNFVGVGMFKKGAKAAGELKGALTSGNPNIITDYYGPMAKTLGAMDEAEKFAKLAGLGKKEIKMMRMGEALVGNVKGKAVAGAEGLMNAAKMQLPKNRATYRDTGISRPLFESAERAQGSHAMNDREMIGRAIFNKWVAKQAGKKGSTKALDDVVSRAVYVDEVGDVTRPLKKGFFEHANIKAMGDVSKHLTDKEIADTERYLMDTWRQKNAGQVMMDVGKKGLNKLGQWGIDYPVTGFNMSKGKALSYDTGDLVTIKRPANKKTGNHWNDWNHSTQLNAIAKQSFNVDSLPKTVDELYDSMKNVTYIKKNKITGADEVSKLAGLKKDTDGVYFAFSKAGSGIVEGGANFRTKIKLDGDGFAVMSDEHNLAEALVGNRLKRLITVSPPMHFNIFRLKPRASQTNSGKLIPNPVKPEVRTHAGKSWTEKRVGGKRGAGNKGTVVNTGMPDVKKFLMDQQPSAETLRAERMFMARKMLGAVSISGGMLSDSSSR